MTIQTIYWSLKKTIQTIYWSLKKMTTQTIYYLPFQNHEIS